jgi:hypothetical protein
VSRRLARGLGSALAGSESNVADAWRVVADDAGAVIQAARMPPASTHGLQRRPLLWALALTAAFGAWEIVNADFMADDFMQLAVLEGAAMWRVLSWSPGTHRFVRTGVDTLELDVSSAGLDDARLGAGSSVSLHGLEATVLSRERGGQTRVRFQFDRSLDDPSVTLLGRRDDHLERVAVPRIGETLEIP